MEVNFLSTPSEAIVIDHEQPLTKSERNGGLHILTPGVVMDSIENPDKPSHSSTYSELSTASSLARDEEITLHSSLIPENAILMETPRGLVLTVQNAIAYENISSPNESGSQPMLSCVPVSFFKSCDVSEDGESSMVCNDVSVTNPTEGEIEQQLQVHSPVITTISNGVNGDDGLLGTTEEFVEEQSKQPDEPLNEVVPVRRKGGWPKGKKRKIKPEVTGPRAPVTGYVLYATDRRKEIKQLHPELGFTEVTKILGQEWSTMDSCQKDKYLDAAEKDKKRYREELNAFRASDAYQETMNKKLGLQEGAVSSNSVSMGALVIDDDDTSNELHCKICNVYFSSRHNKQEHIYGKTHLQNVTLNKEKEFKKQQQEQGLYNSLVLSEDATAECFTTPADNNTAEWPNSTANSNNSGTGTKQSGPVDIHNFMLEFIHKNYEREQEISILRKHLNKSLQENLDLCKDIQDLQDYHCKLQEEIKTLSSTTSTLIVQSDALKMVPTLFGIINL